MSARVGEGNSRQTKTGGISFRPARQGDVVELVDRLAEYAEQSRFKGWGFDKGIAQVSLWDSLRDPDFFTQIGEAGDGKLIAGIAGKIETYFFGGKYAQDYLFYIVEGYRSVTTAVTLLKAWEDWAKAKGVGRVLMSSASGYQPVRFREFLHHMGYRDYSSTYVKDQ